MSEVSVKVNILGRTYPLKIKKSDEERINRAVRLINDRLRDYEQQYAVTDKIDLLSMCSLQLAGELLSHQDNGVATDEAVLQQIAGLESILDKAMQK